MIWIIDQEFETIDTLGDTGYMLFIDTKPIDTEVAEYKDNLPLGLKYMKMTEDLLSPYANEIVKKLN